MSGPPSSRGKHSSRGKPGSGGPLRSAPSRRREADGAPQAHTLRTLNRPRAVRVRVGEDGTPHSIDGAAVEAVRETWLLEDGWWTQQPLRRRYWETIVRGGRSVVVFHDLCSGRWFTQAG